MASAGKNLAVFQGEDGRAHALDAYCCHNGANLAAGGLVKGSCLECPFHGWQFRGDDGKCTHIPYCERTNSKLALCHHHLSASFSCGVSHRSELNFSPVDNSN